MIVSPKRMGSFWEVSIAMRCGMSGRKGLGMRSFTTASMKAFGLMMPGSVTTGRPSL